MCLCRFASLQAARRQAQYEQSAVGKAAIKSVKAVKEDREKGREGPDTAKDWLS